MLDKVNSADEQTNCNNLFLDCKEFWPISTVTRISVRGICGIDILGGFLFASGIIQASSTALFFLSVVIIAVGVYAARALYFAVMQEGKIPLVLTGTAVGLISLVGYTPDIFASATFGYLLDASPGESGFQNVFWMLTAFSIVGGIAAVIYYRLYGRAR